MNILKAIFILRCVRIIYGYLLYLTSSHILRASNKVRISKLTKYLQ